MEHLYRNASSIFHVDSAISEAIPDWLTRFAMEKLAKDFGTTQWMAARLTGLEAKQSAIS